MSVWRSVRGEPSCDGHACCTCIDGRWPACVLQVVSLMCQVFSHLMLVIDDLELYEQQVQREDILLKNKREDRRQKLNL